MNKSRDKVSNKALQFEITNYLQQGPVNLEFSRMCDNNELGINVMIFLIIITSHP